MRPWPITLASVFLLLLAIATLGALAVPSTRQFMPLTWTIAGAVPAFVTGLGLWFMKRWAVVFFCGTWLLLAVGSLIVNSSINIFSLIGLAAIGGLGAIYWRRLG